MDWYSPASGEVRHIDDLAPLVAERVLNTFRQRVQAVYDAAHDPIAGWVIAAALSTLSTDCLLAVGEEPVLINWGMLPPGVSSAADRERHWAATLGALAPLPAPAAWAAEAGSIATPPRLNEPPRPETPLAPAWPRMVREPAIACALALAIYAALNIPGVLRFQGQDALAGEAGGSSTEVALLESYEARRRAIRAALLAPCPLEPVRGGQFLMPPSPSDVLIGSAAREPAAALPETSAQVAQTAPPPSGPQDAAPDNANATAPATLPPTPASGTLADRIARGVVLVSAGRSAGSGFFIAPDLVVTNRHVIAGETQLRIISKATGVVDAQLVSTGGQEQMQDFALLRVPPQRNVMPFELALRVAPLDAVVAAGFPGLHLASDPAFQALAEGRIQATSQLAPVFQTGVVNHLQRAANGSGTLVLHSAEIAPGNSGGPLLDYCGRVVGVNTFGVSEARLPIIARYALGVEGLQAFLQRANARASASAAACRPGALASAETPAPPAAAPPAAPAAPAPAPSAPAAPAPAAPGRR